MKRPIAKPRHRKGPPVDVARWQQAKRLQEQGLSQVQIGLELDPPCAASVVWKGLRRLAKWEAEQQNDHVQRTATAPQD